MRYFADTTSPLAEAVHRVQADTDANFAKAEATGGPDDLKRDGIDIARERKELERARQREATQEAERRDTLKTIAHQAAADAVAAWDRGDAFFAPVLFQPLTRVDAGWETALTQITEVGWHLDSWQVLGPAPEPFGHTVTLIQTLFTR